MKENSWKRDRKLKEKHRDLDRKTNKQAEEFISNYFEPQAQTHMQVISRPVKLGKIIKN